MASITKQPNGTYMVQFTYRDDGGQRRHVTKRGFATKREASAWAEAKAAARKGSTSMTLADFYEGPYTADVRPKVRPSSWRTKETAVREHILPHLGKKRVNEIEAVDIVRWQAKLQSKGYAPTYLRTISSQLSAILNHAVSFYGLRANPQNAVGKMGRQTTEKEMLYWTKEEYLRFSDAVSDRPVSFAVFETLYWTGMREGEALALTPEDIDFRRGTVSITKTLVHEDGKYVFGPPKTARSRRVVTIPGFLAEELREHIEYCGVGPGERLFPVTKHSLGHEMTRGAAAAGVKRIRVHDLRHSHVSLLIDEGFSALAIAERVGHESVNITYRYAHLFAQRKSEIADSLQRLGVQR